MCAYAVPLGASALFLSTLVRAAFLLLKRAVLKCRFRLSLCGAAAVAVGFPRAADYCAAAAAEPSGLDGSVSARGPRGMAAANSSGLTIWSLPVRRMRWPRSLCTRMRPRRLRAHKWRLRAAARVRPFRCLRVHLGAPRAACTRVPSARAGCGAALICYVETVPPGLDGTAPMVLGIW